MNIQFHCQTICLSSMFQAPKHIIFKTTNCKYHQMLTKGHYSFKEHTIDVTMHSLSALPSESEYTVHI